MERLKKSSGVRAVNLAGRLGIRELFALVERCDLYIANDTGPMHVASVVGRPLIAIFGPGDLKRFDPRAVMPGASVFYKQSICAPCARQGCRDMGCLASITPEEVTVEALRLLGKGAPAVN